MSNLYFDPRTGFPTSGATYYSNTFPRTNNYFNVLSQSLASAPYHLGSALATHYSGNSAMQPGTNQPNESAPAAQPSHKRVLSRQGITGDTKRKMVSRRNVPDNASLSKPQALITVNVGKGESMESFQIHKDFLCSHSKFFDKAFNGKFREGETQVMDLEEDEPEVFGLLVQWIYSKTLSGELMDSVTGRATYFFKLIKLWILADEYQMIPLQNDIIKIFYQRSTNMLLSAWLSCYDKASEPLPEHIPVKEEFEFTINFLYLNTMQGSSLRRLMVHLTAGVLPRLSFEHCGDLIPKEMIWDVMMYLRKSEVERRDISLEDFLIDEDAVDGGGEASGDSTSVAVEQLSVQDS